MKLSLQLVDAFAAEPFTGNPAGVCVLDKELEPEMMQLVAREVNAAETAFLVQDGDVFNLRWFTPAIEVALCGHATLASAHVLWSEQHVPKDQAIRFQTRSGILSANQLGDGLIQLDFPADRLGPCDNIDDINSALGITGESIVKTQRDFLVELSSEHTVRRFQPDYNAIARLPCQGVIITAKADGDGFDFVSRYFAPSAGINEDPVTGSAHCTLGPYWKSRLGKSEFVAFQASPRGGIVGVRLQNDRVLLSGKAVKTIIGELRV